MNNEKDPAFLMYSKDWLEGTSVMMPNEKGVYIDLLCHQHQKGELPTDTKRLARMVGLSEKEFERIWIHLKHKFVRTAKHCYNEKLRRVMNERADKGHKNRVIGIFASLIRKSNLSYVDAKKIKSDFNVDEFLPVSKEALSERLTEWFSERLKSIEDGDASGYKIKDEVSADIIFQKPRITDIYKFFRELGENDKDVSDRFYYHYESNGWKVGGNSMVDWKSSCRLWVARKGDFDKSNIGKTEVGKKYKPLD